MAEFNPKVDSVGTNNYINYSERYKGNEGWGTLFEGLAKGADQVIQTRLRSQVNNAVDQANNEYFNIDGLTGQQSGAPGNGWEVGASGGTVTQATPGMSAPEGTDFRQLPKPLQDGQATIQGLGKAYENGTYSETNYWSQLNAKVKALKAQFPGYSDDIDKMAASALNNPTANQLRQSLYTDWANKQGSAQKQLDEDYKYLTQDEHLSYLGTDLAQKALTRSLTPTEIAQAKIAIGAQVSRTEGIKRAETEWKVSKLVDDDKKDKTLRYANNAVQNMFSDAYFRATGATGEGYKAFNANLEKYKADGKIDENELRAIDTQRSQLRTAFQTQFAQIINSQDSEGNVLSKILGPDEIAKLQSTFDKQIEILDMPLGGADGVKNLSVFQMTATFNKAAQDNTMFDVLHTTWGQEAAKAKALNDASGGVYTDLLKANLAKANANGDNAVDLAFAGVLANKAIGDGAGLIATANQAGPSVSDRTKAAGLSAAMKTSLQVMSDTSLPMDQRVNAMQSLYGEGNTDFLRYISDKPGKDGWSSRQRTWIELSSPEAAKAAAELEKSKPGSLDQYYSFLKKSASVIFKDTADTVQSTQTFAKYANITIDQPSGQLRLDLDLSKFPNKAAAEAFLKGQQVAQVSGGGRGPGGPAPLSMADQIELSKVRDGILAVRQLNVILRGVTPAFDAMGVKAEERTQAVLDLMGGIKLDSEKQLPTIDLIIQSLTKPSGAKDSYNTRGDKTYIADYGAPVAKDEPVQLAGNGMINTTFEDHMASAEVPYNKAVGSYKEFNKKVPLLMGKLSSDLGLTNEQAAGIIGNLAHESGGLQPSIPGDGNKAHGWAQWNGPRKKDMIRWTKANGYDPNTDDGNYAYLLHDLQNNFPQVLAQIKQAKTMEQAAKIFMDKYEIPGVPVFSSRLKYGQQALAATQ